LLGGIIDGKVVGPDVVKQYAKLPTHSELIAKFVGSLQSPISGTVGILANLLGGIVHVLNAYKNSLPAEEQTKIEVPVEPEPGKAEDTDKIATEEENN